jgi:hypothetical protein
MGAIMTTETEKSPREIAREIVNGWLDFFITAFRQRELITRIEQALRDRDERAAKIAERPYSDAVAALGPDQPSVVGTKIASAIRGKS